jgi:murein DD-endopeptidase MepM/ murein hydrolase activator NlpD
MDALQGDALQLEAESHQVDLMMKSEQVGLLQVIGWLRGTIARTGLSPGAFMQKAASEEGVGGPYIPLSEVHLERIADEEFSQNYLLAEAVLNQLSDVTSATAHLPLAMPVDERQAHRSSGFGPRLDPFTGLYSFHPGLDFSGPPGTAIMATAPGYVVFAGYDGSYGNMVEVDHGFGIHTRYAHLSGILVSTGARVASGGIIGRLGTTGRSTGPHLHYEVWYDQAVRDPGRFIDAGLQQKSESPCAAGRDAAPPVPRERPKSTRFIRCLGFVEANFDEFDVTTPQRLRYADDAFTQRKQ